MEKVQFVGDKGNIFFECHPAEVRVAIEAIKDYRQLGYAIPTEEKKLAALVPEILKHEVLQDAGKVDLPIEDLMCGLFEILEKKDRNVTHIIMNAMGYAHIRRMDRDLLDVETRASVLRSCRMFAKLWGARIYVDSTVPLNKIYVASTDDEKEPLVVTADHINTNAHVDLMGFLKEMSVLIRKALNAVRRMR